jgi:SSS family solute:Na+ symporter
MEGIDLAILAVYIAGILFLGLWLGRFIKTDKDYFLAGRNLPFWAIGMSIVATDIGALDFVSLSGQTYRYGVVMANMDWIGTMPAIILAAFVFIPYYWRSGVYSVPEFLGRRYNPAVRGIQAVAWTVFFIVNLGCVFWAAARMLDGFLGASFWEPIAGILDGREGDSWRRALIGLSPEEAAEAAVLRRMLLVVLTALLTSIYTITGGLAAVVYTDAIQMVLMFLGGILVVAIGLYHPEKGVGGFEKLQETLIERGHTDHFTLFLPHDSTTPYAWTGVFFGLTLVLAPAYFIANQAIVQRTFGARNEWSAKAGALWGGLLKFCIPFIVVLPGLISLALYPGHEKDADSVYSYMLRDLLPAGVRGIVFAAFFAGLMSTVDSVLNSAATLLTRDFYVGFIGGRPDERRLLRVGRWLTLALVVFGVGTSRLSENFEGIYTAIQTFLSIIQGPTWALLVLGMFWRRATAWGGLSSLVFGLLLSSSLAVWQKVSDTPPFNADEPFFAIAFISFAASAAVNIVVSLLTRPKSPAELRGLVYQASFHDSEVQAALEERAGREDAP